MATHNSSAQPELDPETVVQHSMLQQAGAAVESGGDNDTTAAQRRHIGQDVPLQNVDLTAAETAEEDLPPPAYGESYGQIRDQKDGLGTSASVTDDGRVNIHISQTNRRLSQIFIPALRQQEQSVEDERVPPPPYIPPSLGGEDGVPPPPPLNIVIQVVGSRGDVQPFIALGKVLKDTYGHRVRLATHPNFKDFVEENGLEFFSIGGDPSLLMAFMVKNPGLMPGFDAIRSGDVGMRRKDVGQYIQGCWRSCYETGDGMGIRATDNNTNELSNPGLSAGASSRPFVADCIIANPPSFAHIHCAEKLGVPLHIIFTMPYSPTQAFPHPLANIQSTNADPQLTNYMSYALIDVLAWQGLGDIINRFREKCLGLDPISLMWGPGILQRLKVPHTYCWSPALIPKPRDWGAHISISGFYFLNLASNYTPAADLQEFLDAGPPPVYIGFGSIVLDDPNAMTALIFEAVRKTGQRVLLSKGWGGMGADELGIPDGVFMLGNVPHDWLFKHVSCVIHHGGAGTTAAGITAGRPTVVVPFFGDQPFWGAMVARAGAGPDPIPHKELNADNLAEAINFCLKPETLQRAAELANRIATERGSDTGAQSFHQYLEPDRLRCTLAPSRPAVWRIKRTQMRLSAFAACTLANANLLDFHDLKLFRAQEYATDEGPFEPLSGGASAIIGTFSSMFMGVADLPSETMKALQIHPDAIKKRKVEKEREREREQQEREEQSQALASGPSSINTGDTPRGSVSSRQQSQASLPTMASISETSKSGTSTPITSPNQSESTFNVQDSLSRVRSPASIPGISSRSETRSASTASAQSGQDQKKGSGKTQDYDKIFNTSVDTSKGLGRMVRAGVAAPMEFTMGLTRGFENVPKLWGDDTVRPAEPVKGLRSGLKAAGKGFGLGFYDGVTGMVTQPIRGAQKEGAVGFLKGVGKGIGGVVAKPGAAIWGVPGYMMLGVHKEVQKVFGSSVQNYIIASRTAQGYDEWLQGSAEEKQDVIVRWKLVQKDLKKKRNPEEMVRDILEAQRKKKQEAKQARLNRSRGASESQSGNNAPMQDPEAAMLAMGTPQGRPQEVDRPSVTLEADQINEAIRLSVQETSRGNAQEDANVERAIQENVTQLQQRRQEQAAAHAGDDHMRRAIEASEADEQRRTHEEAEYEEQLKQVLAQSLREQRQQTVSDDEWDSDINMDDEDDEEFERARAESEKVTEKAAAANSQKPPAYDPGHFASASESHQQQYPAEKTTQEKSEEDIVMEYVRKQSLLEEEHRSKGKGRAAATADEDDEELQRALKLSMQGHDADKHGEGSGGK